MVPAWMTLSNPDFSSKLTLPSCDASLVQENGQGCSIEMEENFAGQHLRSARLAAGLSLRGLESRLRGAASAQSISLYERGEVTPRPALVRQIGAILGVNLTHLYSPRRAHVRGAWYRGGVADDRRLRSLVESRLEVALPGILEREAAAGHCWTGTRVLPAVSDALPTSPSGIESGALALRSHWGLGVVPLPNLVRVLEHRGLRVIEVEVDGFDGCVADIELEKEENQTDDESSLVVNPAHWGERTRFTLSYCLGGFIYPRLREEADSRGAKWFAGAFLAPRTLIQQYLGKKRKELAWTELYEVKRHLGISIQGLIHRCAETDIIDSTLQKALLKGAEGKGWCEPPYQEPYAIAHGEEAPQLIENLLLRAGRERLLPLERVGTLLGLTVDELREKLEGPGSYLS